MRKMVVLDEDVNELIRETMRVTGQSFRQVVNEKLRLGIRLAREERLKQKRGKSIKRAARTLTK